MDKGALPGSVHRTKSQIARQHIEELILSGTVRDGGHLTTREVSAALGMSETPVREAMRSLAAEGWLDLHPHLGSIVAPLRIGVLTEIYAIRGALGGIAVELGVASYTAEQLAALDANVARSRIAVAGGDIASYSALNREFHLLLADTPETQWTLKLLTTLMAQTAAIARGFSLVPRAMRRSLREHRGILRAIADGDLAAASGLLVAHERWAGAGMIEFLTRAAPAPASHGAKPASDGVEA